MSEEKADVVVIGGASAGYAAAVAARHAGAEKVIILEKGSPDLYGGNCRYSSMGFRFTHDGIDDLIQFIPAEDREEVKGRHIKSYSAESFQSDLQRVTQGKIDRELGAILVDDSRDALDWLLSLGHRWEFMHPLHVNGEIHHNAGKALMPKGGGLGLMEHWIRLGKELGIDLRYRSRVGAIHGDFHGVEGVRVLGPDGEYDMEAKSVILASGGFQASAEKRARYLAPNADLMKVRGSRHNTGEVLDMAVALGAKTSGQWKGAHASPVDMHANPMEIDDGVNRYGYTYGISVTTDGQRFFDEGEAHRAYTYAKTGWAVLQQPGGIAYQIYDQVGLPLIPTDYIYATAIEADTIGELASKIGVRPDVLQATVDEYNEACDETVEFDPSVEDGRGTVGLAVKKTNWSVRIEKPPFVAYGVTGGITFSFGGVSVNRDSQVLNTSGDPMKGLYANGDVVGMFYHNYPSCSGMTRNVVFGGRAGAAAATAA